MVGREIHWKDEAKALEKNKIYLCSKCVESNIDDYWNIHSTPQNTDFDWKGRGGKSNLNFHLSSFFNLL